MAAKTSGVCEKLRAALSSLCCESAVVTLALVSVLAISGEMLIDYGVLTAPSSQAERTQSPPSTSSSPPATNNKTSDSRGDTPTGDGGGEEALLAVYKVFHYISFVIAILFLLEIVIKLLAFRRKFLVRPWQVLDMLIVAATVMVEVAFEIKGRVPALEACTFVVILRLWRLPHACNIRAKAIRRDMEQDLEVWKSGKSTMEKKCQHLQDRYNEQKAEIHRLEQEVSALRRERNMISQLQITRSSETTGSKVASDTVESLSANQHDSKHHVPEEDPSRYGSRYVTAESEEEDVMDKTGRQVKEDKVSEEDQETESCRQYTRSGSESSLSYQDTQHEVRVQIEGQNQATNGTTPHEVPGDSNVRSSPHSRHKESAYSYVNEGFSPDTDHRHSRSLQDMESSGTYTTADGIPMTDL